MLPIVQMLPDVLKSQSGPENTQTEIIYEHKKMNNLKHAKTKAQISCAVTAQLISTFVFAT